MPTESPTVQPEKRRHKRFRRVLLWLLVIGVVAAGGLAYRHYTNPERIRALAEDSLQRYFHGRVTVGSASFSWSKGIRLFDVAVAEIPRAEAQREPFEPAAQSNPVFSCREVRVTHDLWLAVLGEPRVKTIIALEPTCSIVRETVDGRTNLTGLLRLSGASDPRRAVTLPTIELRDAHVRVASRQGFQDRTVEDLTLTVRTRPSKRNPYLYDIAWQGDHGYASSGHSQIDLQTGRLRNIQGGLPWMSIEAVMLAINAKYDGAGAWYDLLGLDGIVRARDYDFSGAPVGGLSPRGPLGVRDAAPAETGGSVTIELSDASLSIPINEEERLLTPQQRYLRFDSVRGHVHLTGERIRAEFAGRFHGSDCQVSATIRCGTDFPVGQGDTKKLLTLDDVDFEAQLTVKDLELPRRDPATAPAEARFVEHWPRLVRFYEDYDPHGEIDLEIAVTKRAGVGAPISVRRLVLAARGADASCRFFPYRLNNLEGTVEYTPDGVFLRNLRGRHGGGIVTVEGRLAKPFSWAAKELKITGKHVAIDNDLWGATASSSATHRYRKIRDRFHPKGTIDVELVLTQPEGDETGPAKWRSQSTITLRDLSVTYVGFPYPVDHLTGTLTVDTDELEVIELSGRSGQARINMDGTVLFSHGQMTGLDLALRARDVPFDDRLLAALPTRIRNHVDVFHPQGHFDFETSLSLDVDTKQVVHDSHVALQRVSIQHEKFPVELTEILGGFHTTGDEIVVDGLTGRLGDATFSAEGVVSAAGAPHATMLVLRSRNLHLDDALRTALPSKMRDAMADWKIDGPIATETIFRTDPDGPQGVPVVRTVARLSDVTVTHSRFPVPLRDVRADITVDESGVRASNIEAQYGSATIVGQAFLPVFRPTGKSVPQTDRGEAGTITLTATGVPLDESLRGLLPDRLAAVWDRLKPSGAIDLHLDQVRYERSEPDQPWEWSVDGSMTLNDVALAGVANVKRVFGTLVVSGTIVDRLGGTSLGGDLTLSSVDVLGQHLDTAESMWTYAHAADGEGLFVLRSIRGQIYDGSLTGQVEVMFDSHRTDYSLTATVCDVQIEPLLNADRASRSALAEPVDARGVADAHLYLSGVVGDPSRRRGGGRFKISDGHIYRLPIILAILNVLNLSVPNEDAFNEAQADFCLLGNRVQFEDIRLRGSALALVGSGSMSLPDRGVDLGLINVSPHQWSRLPVLADFVEGASREIVELRVTGPLSGPTVQVKPFPSITEEFKRLFRKKKPKKIQPAAS